MVGALYDQDDERRDAGFSIFYMGINLGAFIGPLIAGYLAQNVNWHLGFAIAGVGMLLGLIQYVVGRNRLKPALERLAQTEKQQKVVDSGGFTATEWKRIGAIVIFFVFSAVFWGAYEQAGSTLNLFADRYTRLTAFGFSFPSSWFQSVPAIFVVVLAPCFAWLWVKLGDHEPSSPTKFALGLLFVGLAFLLLVPAAMAAQGSAIRVSPWWLVGSYLVQEFGELCLSPVGLSLVTKLAPVRVVGLMMGVWFLSISAGDKLAGFAAGFFSTMPLPSLFGWVAGIALVAAFFMFVLIKPVKKLMGGVQ
jgi:POT family proton-dependent oligopeptide transporter